MPTLFILLGFRFSFFANDYLPIHIHAIKGKIYAKIQVLPKVELIENAQNSSLFGVDIISIIMSYFFLVTE